jgi:curved DNA-binding protein CbpA
MDASLMNDPYQTLGVERGADEDQIRAAYRQQAKATHPDTGGSTEEFIRGQKAFELLNDPVRRKVFDETGYDLQLADAMDLQGMLVIETLVNDIVLDSREPGSFDPVAGMRAKLLDDIIKARFHIHEMEGHRARIDDHRLRLKKSTGNDILGYMLRARAEAISGVIGDAEKKIAATERALEMLDGYVYAINEVVDDSVAASAAMQALSAELGKDG